MTLNSQGIIQEVRQEIEVLLEYVTGDEAQEAHAAEIERGLLRRLLRLGARLLLLFFIQRATAYPRTAQTSAQGEELPYQGQRTRHYFSIFGKLAVPRPYFYQSGVGGASPLDGELSLGADCYSEPLREMVEELAVCMTYEKAQHFVARYLGQSLSTRTVQQMIAHDASEVLTYYEQRPAPKVSEEGSILVLQGDGKGVPLVRPAATVRKVRLGRGEKRNQKKEALVTTVYTVAPYLRTADEFVDALFATAPTSGAAAERPEPQHKQLWATLDGKDAALERLQSTVRVRQGNHITHQIALCDGCEALQQRIQDTFADFTLILDVIHVSEYLWKAATALWGECDEPRIPWVKAHLHTLLSGQTTQVVSALRDQASQPHTSPQAHRQLTQSAAYFARNAPYMAYDDYLAHGWPIASGVIEGACRHFVKDRFELSGMRWTQDGAEHLLRLRAVHENDDWDAYHAFRQRQRHVQLYRTPFPDQPVPEELLLDSNPLPLAA